jgi:7-cyano-7-deazaguanine synthase in queuosine biosynthesis
MATSHLILLSGGIDSACLLADRVVHEQAPGALFVDYGQPVAEIERDCSAEIASHYGAPWDVLQIGGLEVCDGEIPGRNALLTQLAFTHLGGERASCIYLAIHAGTPYRDCTPEFIGEIQRSLLIPSFSSKGFEVARRSPRSKTLISECSQYLQVFASRLDKAFLVSAYDLHHKLLDPGKELNRAKFADWLWALVSKRPGGEASREARAE